MSTKDQVHSPALPESPSQASEMAPADADGDTDAPVLTGDDVFDKWSLAARVVFLWQLAAFMAGAERPVSRRQMRINSNAFAKAMEYLTFCHIIHPVLGEDRRPRWHWDAAESVARWMADYGGK